MMDREAGYPKHPATVIVPPNDFYSSGLTEHDIWEYYDSVKEKLAPQLYGSPVTTVIVTPTGLVVRRNDSKTKEPIRVESVEDFDRLNNGRAVEFHKAMGKTTNMVWVDLDPREGYPWPKVIDAAIVVRDSLMGFNGIENVRIAFSGNRGFHVRGFLAEPMDIDEARRMVIQRLESEVVPRVEGATTGFTDKPDAIRLDVSTLHSAGSLRVPWSLNAKTGLMALDYEATGKGLAELEKADFSITNLEKYSNRNSDIPIGISIRAALDPAAASSALQKLKDTATEGGFRVYLVGGSVRDKLMGKDPKDLDVVVLHPDYGLEAPKRLSDALAKAWGAKGGELTNQGTVMVRLDSVPIDLAAPRSETYQEGSRKPEVAAAGIKEDAMRRDFTVNAIYEDLQNTSPDIRGRIVDPTGKGLADLDSKLLRSPNPQGTFIEDPLRMLRAIRFHEKTGFELDPETAEEMRKALPKLKEFLGTQKLSWERVQEEFQKTLMGQRPGKAMRMMTDYGISEHLVPEWKGMVGLPHDTPHHLETVDEHTMMVLDEVGKMAESDIALRLAALLHDIGKPTTKGVGDQLGSFLGHEEIGSEMADAILRRLRFPNDIIERVKFIVGHHMRPHGYKKEWSDKAVRRFMREMGNELENILRLAEADTRGRKTEYPVEEGMAGLEELRRRIEQVSVPGQEPAQMKPLIDGNELQAMFPGRGPGRWIKEVQDHLIDLQLGDPAMTKEQAVEAVNAFMAAKEPPSEQKTAALAMEHDFSFDPNSTENEGRWRIRDPKDFNQDTFRRWKNWSGVLAPAGVTFIVGDAGGEKALQTIRFDKGVLDEKKAAEFWDSVKDKPGFKRIWEWPRKSKLVVGTVGFCHDRWRDGFYRECQREDFLDRYGEVFGGVEVTSTRHALPTTRVLFRWASRTPSDFVFAPHAPAAIRPSTAPWQVRSEMMGFLSRMSVLGEKLGPIVVTIPVGDPFRPGDAKAFLDSLPHHRYAFNVRASAWCVDEFFNEVMAHGHTIVTWMGCPPGFKWFFNRVAAKDAEKLRDVLEGTTAPGYSFVVDKSSDPSQRLLKVLHDLGLLPIPGGVVPSRKIGPNDIRTPEGPSNPHGPIHGPDSPPFEEDEGTADEEKRRPEKHKRMTEPMTLVDDMNSDGRSDPFTDVVDGDTRTTL